MLRARRIQRLVRIQAAPRTHLVSTALPSLDFDFYIIFNGIKPVLMLKLGELLKKKEEQQVKG
jgi:hypothetical protein